MREFVSDIAFTPTVKAAQEQRGSRRSYARMEQKGGWHDTIATFDMEARRNGAPEGNTYCRARQMTRVASPSIMILKKRAKR